MGDGERGSIYAKILLHLYKVRNQRLIFMPYTTEEGGRLNNFAREPKIYQAEPPNKTQQRNYVVMGVAALVLVGGLMVLAFSVSSVS